MKRLLTALALFAALPAWAAWQFMTETDTERHYIDLSTIRASGNMRRAWTLVDWKVPFSDGTRSIRAFIEYDCKEARSRMLDSTAFTGQMGTGDPFPDNGISQSNWKFAAPNTVGETNLQIVCGNLPPPR